MDKNEFKNIIKNNWGIELDTSIVTKLLQEISTEEKIACVIDSNKIDGQGFRGYAICLSNRILLINDREQRTISINRIESIDYQKGVANTTTGSVLVLHCGTEMIKIASNRNELMNEFYGILRNKGRFEENIEIQSKESAVGKMIIWAIVAIVLLFFASALGQSM